MAKNQYFGISEAARRAGVAEGTMRKYDNAGIITAYRSPGGSRLFTEEHVKRVQQYRAQRNQPVK